MEALGEGTYWDAALAEERRAGEVRANLVRVLAIAAFYANHLFHYFVDGDLDPKYHAAVTAIAATWVVAAVLLHILLAQRPSVPWLPYGAVVFDAVEITALLLVSDGPKSSLLFLYLLLIATAPLRLSRRVVWTATLLSIAGYLVLCGHARWVKPERRVPRRQQVLFAIGLVCAGALAGQGVRQGRRLALGYADRVTPEDERSPGETP